jgi:hypothetical protein
MELILSAENIDETLKRQSLSPPHAKRPTRNVDPWRRILRGAAKITYQSIPKYIDLKGGLCAKA